MWSQCSSAVLQKMMMSSKKAMAKLQSYNICAMSSRKYAGAHVNPKGTLMYLYFPNSELNAVLGMDASSKGVWWYPAQGSDVEKYFTPFS